MKLSDSKSANELILCERCSGTYKRTMEKCPACRASQREYGREIGATARNLTPDERRDAYEASLQEIQSNITTLQTLPGHRITASHGVVYASMSHTKWKANTQKKRLTTAFDGALALLLEEAHGRQANAIVGLQFAANSSEGGTAVLGGSSDAIIVMGSAVTVVPEAL